MREVAAPRGTPSPSAQGRSQALDRAEAWLGDGLRVLDGPGGLLTREIDMSRSLTLVGRLRARGVHATYAHVIVRAVALALRRHPDLHFLLAGGRRLQPTRVDIGLSVAGGTNAAPVMVIEEAGEKPLLEVAKEIIRRRPEIAVAHARFVAALQRWGWLVPFGFLRRFILRWLNDRLWWRRKLVGTFQVTGLPSGDVVVPFLFLTSGAVGYGGIRDRVIAIDGKPAVRPTVVLSCAIDHKAWDGVRLATFVDEVRKILESDALAAEV